MGIVIPTPATVRRPRTPGEAIVQWTTARQAMLMDPVLRAEEPWEGEHLERIAPYLRALAACPLSTERLALVIQDFARSPYTREVWRAILRHPDRRARWNEILGLVHGAMRDREITRMATTLLMILTPRRLASALRRDGVAWPAFPAARAMAAKIQAPSNPARNRQARYLQQRLAYYLTLAPGTSMAHRRVWARLVHLGGGVRGELLAHPDFPKADALQILWEAIDTSAITGLRRGAAKHTDWRTDPDMLLVMSSGPRSLSTALLVLPELPLAERHALFARAVQRLPGAAVGLLEDPVSRALLSPLPATLLSTLLAHRHSAWFHTRLYAILPHLAIDGTLAAVTIPARFQRAGAAALAKAHGVPPRAGRRPRTP